MSYQMITDNQQLADFCHTVPAGATLALDTEFIRTQTYLPKLALIQLYAGDALVLVDPLTITQWQPLQQLLQRPDVVKIIHSCSEDLEAFASVGLLPIAPMVDTQVAVELLGWGSSMGYAKLVAQLLSINVDKSESRTDWLARPLATTQLEYAANDVLYLWQLWPQLQASLSAAQMQLLLADAELWQSRRERNWPLRLRYLDLKNSWQFQGIELAIMQLLCEWRHDYAVRHDVAMGLVLKDGPLYELAKRRPKTLEQLSRIEGLAPRDIRRHGELWLSMIARCHQAGVNAWPAPFYHGMDQTAFKTLQQTLADALKAAAEAAKIPASVLSVKRQQAEYINWCWRISDEERAELPLPELLLGWRFAIIRAFLPIPAHVAALMPTT